MSVTSENRQAKRFGYIILFLLALVIMRAGSAIAAEEAIPAYAQKEKSPGQSQSTGKKTDDVGVVFEEPPLKTDGDSTFVHLPEPDDCLDSPGKDELPRIAIIIDDMGYHQKLGGELLDLDLNLTFSFLPHAPFTRVQEEQAWKMGRDVLVHMPMEPHDPQLDPGPGTLYLKDPLEDIALAVEKNLEPVPHAIGVNNHMGSKFTADRSAMQEVLKVLHKRGLFFVDSLTTPDSVGVELARRMGIRTGSRITFLDNSHTQEDICRQLKRLVAYAKKHGAGIGIGHPNRATINALKQCRELLLQQVRVVGIHELVK